MHVYTWSLAVDCDSLQGLQRASFEGSVAVGQHGRRRHNPAQGKALSSACYMAVTPYVYPRRLSSCSFGSPSSAWTRLTSSTSPVYCMSAKSFHASSSCRPTLPLSSDSLTQSFPSILFSLMTILSGFDTSSGVDAFRKSFERNVPMPNDAASQLSRYGSNAQLTAYPECVAAFL